MLLSSGKTKLLVYVSATSCIISLPLTVFLAPKYNVGAAVIGYFVYSVLEINFFYFYYIPHVLKLNALSLFLKGFISAVFAGALAALVAYKIGGLLMEQKIVTLIINSILFSILYGGLVLMFIMSKRDTQLIIQKIRK